MLPDGSTLCMNGQLVAIGYTKNKNKFLTFYSFAGKVYSEFVVEKQIDEIGDYFEFIKNLREGKYNDKYELTEVINLTSKVYDLMNKHVELASQYELHGNTQGSMYLRYVGNMLAALLRGQEATTILPG